MTGNSFRKTEFVKNLISSFCEDIEGKGIDVIKMNLESLIEYSYDSGRSTINENISSSHIVKSKEITEIIPENYIYSDQCKDIIKFLIEAVKDNTTNNRLNLDFDMIYGKEVLAALRTVYSLAIANCFDILKDDYKKKLFLSNRERILNGSL